jgi:hypothetical protein
MCSENNCHDYAKTGSELCLDTLRTVMEMANLSECFLHAGSHAAGTEGSPGAVRTECAGASAKATATAAATSATEATAGPTEWLAEQ